MLVGMPTILKSTACEAMFLIFLTWFSDSYALTVGVVILLASGDEARYLFADVSPCFEARLTMYDWVGALESIVAASASILNDDKAIPAAVTPMVI